MVYINGEKANVLGVIAEYNPFHNGHLHHLEKSIEITNSDFVVAIMSGNMVQRSEPAILDKWARTEMALKSGVDLVIELPTAFATSAAEDFAYGSIKILKELKIIDFLSFGSAHGEIDDLETIADIFIQEPEDFVEYIETSLHDGVSYPKAISNAINSYTGTDRYSKILSDPNNVLGIEYIKQIKKQNFSITAITIKRNGETHNSLRNTEFASGTAIRNAIKNNEDISSMVPYNTFEVLKQNEEFININDLAEYEQILFYKIRKISLNDLANIQDVTEGLENRIKKAAYISNDYNALIDNIKTKRYTESKIRRILLNILLDITKKDMEIFKKSRPYMRVLGFNNRGKALISEIAAANPKLDIIISVSSFEKNNTKKDINYLLSKDILSTDLYALSSKPYLPAGLDYVKKVISFDENKFN